MWCTITLWKFMKNYSKDELQKRLRDVDWQIVLNCNNINLAWLKFRYLFQGTLDSIAPTKEAHLKQCSEP